MPNTAAYYKAYRQRRIAMKRCLKCKLRLFKAGLCKKHYKINRDNSRRYRSAKVSRQNRCGVCSEFGHYRPTCPHMRSIRKRDRNKFLSWHGPQSKI